MAVHRYRLGPMDNNTFVLVDEPSGDAAIVDPSFQSDTLWPEIQERKWKLRYVLNTHAHYDHVIGNGFYVEKSGAALALHGDDLDLLRSLPEQGLMFGRLLEPSPAPETILEDGQTLTLGETEIRVLHTPGHSPGGVTFLVEDCAIVGDCLFAGSIGRTDLPGGSYGELMRSIRERLLTLPDATRVLPGHGDLTTVEIERTTNPFLREKR